ncbi:AraC family transcriptional regulator [Paenibacillus baekrokdamisoli]|uniref:AraC family transcriptional regulator n=1 Tax=Paenibacillus baekrokdamisoli TaxID=1712516 RepID=A0A3G9J3X2_9BACL|nr:AraC family transcriptional regulator [Paenibacillus baekrokdamisoli]MBB3067401.1 AraC-like DNA-binding protein [Paenibacillus baekrokdamisoli]BBH19413.1 AraC family transcriptional regulator [Paenibacillus baekrokdamisoli]
MEVFNELEEGIPVGVIKWTPSSLLETFHWHTSLEIGYCLSGTGWFYFGDKKFRVKPGDVFIVNNMERHIAQSDPEDPSQYLFVFFNKEVIEVEEELLIPFFYSPRKFNNQVSGELEVARKIGQIIVSLTEEIKKKKTAYHGMLRSYIYQICVLLSRHFENQISIGENKKVFSLYYKLGPILTYLHENFREPLELSVLAEKLGLSVSRTRHLFQEVMGEGFKEYLLHLRVNEARKLLLNTDLSIVEVCYQSGFQSHNPFYHAFQKIVGMSPGSYKNEALKIKLPSSRDNCSFEI